MEDTIVVKLDNRNDKPARQLRLVIEVESSTHARLAAQAKTLKMPVNVLVAAQVIDRIQAGGAYTVIPEVPI